MNKASSVILLTLGIAFLILISCKTGAKLISVEELQDFLDKDDTNVQTQYYSTPHPCFWFSYRLIFNGWKAGLHFDLVSIVFSNYPEPHDLVCIETNQGVINVEPQKDRIVPSLVRGMDYAPYLDFPTPLIVDYWKVTPWAQPLGNFRKSDGSRFYKIDNPIAANTSFDNLLTALTFIPQKYDFRAVPGNCGDYAEATFNELEAQGIRSAIVFVIIGEGTHTFNAFDTIDQGRVYADLTEGVLAIAEKVNGRYRVVRKLNSQIRIQELGYEKDFYIFW